MNKKIKDSDDQILKLKIRYPGKLLIEGTIEYRILKYLFKYINAILAIKTDAGYYIGTTNMSDFDSGIIIDILDKSEIDRKKLISKRIKTIISTLENFDFNNSNKSIKWCLRAIKILKIDVNKFLYIKHNDKYYYIHLKIFNTDMWKSHVVETHDPKTGLTIKQIIDPIVKDYGIYINHSKKFTDFCLYWNILHLYEHIMVPWNILDNDDVICTNGFTTPTGLCYCFRIVKTIDKLIESYNYFITFFNKVRNGVEFLKEHIKLEERRTFSESMESKAFSSFERADPTLYDKGYDTEVFKYYANQPLEIILITPEEIDVSKLKKLNKMNPVPKPETRIFKEPTLAMFRNRMIKTIIIEDMKHKTDLSYLGVDCVLNSTIEEDLSGLNILITTTFRLLSGKKLEKYINNNIIPGDNFGISGIDDLLKHTSFYTFDC